MNYPSHTLLSLRSPRCVLAHSASLPSLPLHCAAPPSRSAHPHHRLRASPRRRRRRPDDAAAPAAASATFHAVPRVVTGGGGGGAAALSARELGEIAARERRMRRLGDKEAAMLAQEFRERASRAGGRERQEKGGRYAWRSRVGRGVLRRACGAWFLCWLALECL